MVALITGNTLGLSLNSPGTNGQSGLGRANEQVYVNSATGNVVVQGSDEYLASVGLDTALIRTYNSQGLLADDNGDNWQLNIASLINRPASPNAAGSTVTKRFGDGAQALYTFDSARGLYVSSDGGGASDTLNYNSSTQQWVWTDGSSRITETYNSNGQLINKRDSDGNTASYIYTGSLLTQITDASGQSTFLDYSGNNLTQIRTVSQGVTQTLTRYGYDTSNRLTSVTIDLTPQDNVVADGRTYVTSYTYDGTSRRIATITQTDGTKLTFTYYANGKVKDYTDALGNLTTFTYTPGAVNQVDVLEPLGRTTTYRTDSTGRLLEVLSPTLNAVRVSTKYEYDVRGNVTKVTDGLSQVTVFEYDANDNLTLTRDHAGNTVTYTYNSANQRLTETHYLVADPDKEGAGLPSQPLTTRYLYDIEQHLRFAVSAEGRVTEYRYNTAGSLVATLGYLKNAYPVGSLTPTTALIESQLTSWVASQPLTEIERVDYTYDFRGQVQTTTTYSKTNSSGVGVVDGTESIAQFVYDQRGKLLKTISGKGDVVEYTYDGLGRIRTTVQWLGAQTLTTLSEYDDLNGKTKITLANGLITTSTYDKASRLFSIVDTNAAGQTLETTRYFYDALHRFRGTRDDTGVRTFRFYDVMNRLIGEVDGTGSVTEYRYNQNSQLTRTISYATALTSTQLASLVDGSSNPTNVAFSTIRPAVAASDINSWQIYDAAGRLLKTVDTVGAVTEMAYDGDSRVKHTVAYFTRLTAAALGALGDTPTATAATVSTSSNDRYARNYYDNDGLLRAAVDGEGYATEYLYDKGGRLVQTIRYNNAVTIGANFVSPAAHADDQYTYHYYNARGALAGTVNAEGYLTEYKYDKAGNRTQEIRYANKAVGSVSTSSTLDTLRPAINAEDRTDLTAYDALNRVIQQTNPEGVVTQYTYDSVGNLVRTDKAFGTSDVRVVQARYDLRGNVIGELTGEGSRRITAGMTQTQIDTIWRDWGLTHTYDSVGRRIMTVDQYGNKSRFYYDADGRLTHALNALGEVSETQYNALGELTAKIRYGTRMSASTLNTLNGGLVNTALTNAVNTIKNASLDSKTTYAETRATLSGGTTLWRTQTVTDEVGVTSSTSLTTFGDRTFKSQDSTDPLDVSPTGTKRQFIEANAPPDRRGLVRFSSHYDILNGVVSNAIDYQTSYDAFGRIITTTDGNYNVSQTTYDRLGQVVQTKSPAGYIRYASYDAFGRTLTQTDTNNNVTRYAYNKAERSVTITTPENVQVKTVYNVHGEVQSVTDGKGNISWFGYDSDGRLIAVTDNVGGVSYTNFDRAGNVLTTRDRNGNVVKFSYDAANRELTRTVDPTGIDVPNDNPNGLNLVTSYTYDAKGSRLTITDPNGTVTNLEYDLKGQLRRQIVDPAGLNLITEYTYEGRGFVLTTTDPSGTVTRYRYDAHGRRTSDTTAGATRSYRYDGNDHLVSATDANGNITRYVYNNLDQLIYEIDGTGAVTQNNYDTEGRVTATLHYATRLSDFANLPAAPTIVQVQSRMAIDPPRDQVAHRVYNKDGKIIATVNALGEVVKFKYDNNGNVIERYAYALRLNMATWSPGTEPFPPADTVRDQRSRTIYDNNNRAIFNVVDVSGGFAVTENRYDHNGNVVERIQYGRTIPAITAITEGAVRVAVTAIANSTRDIRSRMVYDKAGRLTHTADGVGAVTQSFYDKNGNVVKTVRYATAISASALPTTVAADNVRDRVTIRAFDKANREVYSLDTLGGIRQRVYDKNGNVLQTIAFVQPVNAPTSTTNHTATSLAALVTSSMRSDTRNRIGFYTYDALNRNVYAVDSQGGVVKTDYDAAGNAIQSTAYARQIDISGITSANATATIPGLIEVDGTHDRITKRQYDAVGRCVGVLDALGYVTEKVYTATGSVARTVQYGSVIPTEIAPSTILGVAHATLPGLASQRHSDFDYDQAGRLIKSTDAYGYTESYTYDGTGSKRSFTNKKGAIWTYEYDAGGRLMREISPQVHVAALAQSSDIGALGYDGANSGLRNVETWFSYDALGSVLTRTEAFNRPEQRVTSYEYDALGRQVKATYPSAMVQDPIDNLYNSLGRKEVSRSLFTETRYDTLGNAYINFDTGGYNTSKVYDRAGQLRYEIDAMGYITGYTRNAFGEATGVTRYAQTSGLESTVSPISVATVDARLATLDHSKDRAITNQYDRLGRVIWSGEPTSWVYDSNTNSVNLAGKATSTSYNAFGEVFQVLHPIAPFGDSWNYVSTRYYDQVGNQIAEIDALGYLTEQDFDAVGNVRVRREYDASLFDLTNEWSPEYPPTSAPVVASSDFTPPARVMRYAYDLLDRKISQTQVGIEYADGSTLNSPMVAYGNFPMIVSDVTTTFGYDAIGNQTRVTDANGDSTYTYYDALGRITAVVAPSYLAKVDALDPNSVVVARPLTEFYYDARGNVVAKYELAYGADVSANESGYQRYNGNASARGSFTKYDKFDRAIQTTDGVGVSRYSSYNAIGRLARTWQAVTDDRGIQSVVFQAYKYDALGRLTQTIDPPAISDLTPGTNQVQTGFVSAGYRMHNGQNYLAWNDTKAPFLSTGTSPPTLQLFQQTESGGHYLYARFRPYGSTGAWTSFIVDTGNTGPLSAMIQPVPSAPYALEIDIAWGSSTDAIAKRYTGRIIKSSASATPVMTATPAGKNTYSVDWSGLIDLNAGAVRVSFQYSGVTRTQEYAAPTEVAGGVDIVWDDFNIYGANASQISGLTVSQQINGVWTTLHPGSPLTQPGLVSTNLSYNSFGDVTTKTLSGVGTGIAAGSEFEYFDYDAAGRLWRTNSGKGVDRIFLYDVEGRVTSTIESDGSGGTDVDLRTVADPLAASGLTQVRRTDLHYDALGRIVKEVRPEREDPEMLEIMRPEVYYTYDRFGNRLSVSDPRNSDWVTEYRYNANDQVLEVLRPEENMPGTEFTMRPQSLLFYDKVGRQIATAELADYRYDVGLGEYQYDYNINRKVYNPGGLASEERDALGNLSLTYYNLFGEKVSSLDALNRETRYSYDNLGRLVKTTHPDVVEGATLTRPARVIPGTTDLIGYDELGRKVSQTNGDGETIRYRYDLRGNIVETILPMGESSKSAFDALGRKIAERDANGYASTWRYDYFGRVQAHTDLGAAKYSYSYDNAGQLTGQNNTRGQDMGFFYDTAGQLIGARVLTSPGQYTDAFYAYDAAGNRVYERTALDEGAIRPQEQTMLYDRQGRMIAAYDGRVNMEIQYDLLGNRRHIHTFVYDGAENIELDRYFLYDKMNRQIVVDAANLDAPLGSFEQLGERGHYVTYDAVGNRVSDVHWTEHRAKVTGQGGAILGYNAVGQPIYASVSYGAMDAGMTKEIYTYDSMNRLQTMRAQNDPATPDILLDYRTYDRAGRLLDSGPQGRTLASGYASLKNALGGDNGVVDGLEWRANTYDDNGKLINQLVKDAAGNDKYRIDYANGYDAAGNLKRYSLTQYGESSFTNYYDYSYDRFDSYKTKTIIGQGTTSSGGNTTNYYDVNGYLVSVDDATMNQNDRSFVNDIGGKALTATQNGNTQTQFIVNGEVLGRYGMAVDPDQPRNPETGEPNFKFIADFNFSYQPITPNYPAATSGLYAVRTGDTLQSIAQGAYGDSSYWYLIADANGLSGAEPLTQGTMLTIPNRVGTSHNNFTNYKPYDPNNILGDTTPFLPQLQGGCGGWGLILAVAIAVAVAVAVSIVTYGAAASIMVAALGPTLAAGTAGVVATGVVAGAAAGLAGSFAGQAVLASTGAQEGISGKQILIGGAVGAFTGGAGAYLGIGANTANSARTASQVAFEVTRNVAVSMSANSLGQGLGMLFGTQRSFHWDELAGAGIGAALGTAAGVQNPNTGFGTRLGVEMVSGIAAHSIQNPTWQGGKQQLGLVVADAFGNALGNALGNEVMARMAESRRAAHAATKSGAIPSNAAAAQAATDGSFSRGMEEALDEMDQAFRRFGERYSEPRDRLAIDYLSDQKAVRMNDGSYQMQHTVEFDDADVIVGRGRRSARHDAPLLGMRGQEGSAGEMLASSVELAQQYKGWSGLDLHADFSTYQSTQSQSVLPTLSAGGSNAVRDPGSFISTLTQIPGVLADAGMSVLHAINEPFYAAHDVAMITRAWTTENYEYFPMYSQFGRRLMASDSIADNAIAAATLTAEMAAMAVPIDQVALKLWGAGQALFSHAQVAANALLGKFQMGILGKGGRSRWLGGNTGLPKGFPELSSIEGTKWENMNFSHSGLRLLAEGNNRVVYVLKENPSRAIVTFKTTPGHFIRQPDFTDWGRTHHTIELMKSWNQAGLPSARYYGKVTVGWKNEPGIMVDSFFPKPGTQSLKPLIKTKHDNMLEVVIDEMDIEEMAYRKKTLSPEDYSDYEAVHVRDWASPGADDLDDRLTPELLSSLKELRDNLLKAPRQPNQTYPLDIRINPAGDIFVDGPHYWDGLGGGRTWEQMWSNGAPGRFSPQTELALIADWKRAFKWRFEQDYILPLERHLAIFPWSYKKRP